MLSKGKAVVISTLRYKDYDLIIKCYTELHGIVTYLQKGIFKSKKSKTKIAYFQPLMLLELEENFDQNRSLQFLNEIRCYYPFKSLHTNIYKASLTVFLAEILAGVLKEEESNDSLFQFIETSIQLLDMSEKFSNFHLLFLLKLTKYLGFYPNQSETDLDYFNLEIGTFEKDKTSMYVLEGSQKNHLKSLLKHDFGTINELKLSSVERRELLKALLLYFELHLGNFKKPKSLEIFSDVFH